MALHIEQDCRRLDDLKWSWCVWLEGDDDELDAVKRVAYLLHSTFNDRNPVRTNRAEKFRLDASGWGGFLIRASVQMKDGRELDLVHNLRLGDERDEAPTKDGPAEPRVLVSYSAGDAPLANSVCHALLQCGLNVLATDGGPHSEEQVAQFDAAVVVLPTRVTPWMDREIETMKEAALPFIPVAEPGTRTDYMKAVADLTVAEIGSQRAMEDFANAFNKRLRA